MSSTSNNSLVGGAIVKFDYDRPPQTEFYKVTTENQEKYIEKMKKVKIADYDNTAFLSNCLEFNKASNSTYMNKRLTAALALQSKLPVYCLAGCGAGQHLYGTENVAISLSITDQNGGEILDEEKLPKQVVPRTLDWMMNQEPNAKLEHIIFVSDNTEKQSGYEDNTFGDDIVEVAYIFRDENDGYYSILRNKIGGKKYNGYYKLFTVCRHTIVRFQDANGKIQKTVVSPNYYENELISSLEEDDRYKENVLKEKIFAPVKFKIGNEKKEYLSMLFYVKGNCNLTVQSLQSKILAVHTLMPTEEQIKADSRPFWVAKRLKYEDYFVTTEDVTLRNGKSYYWDIGECWVARKNGNPSKDELNNYTAKYNSWYWDNGPFLPGNEETNKKGNWDKKHYLAYINKSDSFRDEEMPPNDLGIEYCGDTSDVTRHTTNIQTVNIQPYQIATKAYAVIIKSKEFQEAEGGDLQNGGYYINGMLSGKGGYAGFINAADKGAYGKDCFINGRGDMPPNNGVLYNPKDELFTAYFLVKGSVSENLVKKQYEILNTLKNGSREVSSAPQGESSEHKEIREEKKKESEEGTLQGKDYYPNYYKKFIDKNNEVIKKLNDAAEDLKNIYRERVKEINNAIDAFENGRPATSEIGALECLGNLIDGSIQSEKLGESNKELLKSVNDKKIKLDTDEIKEKILYKCPDGNIISKISNDKLNNELAEDEKVIDDMKNPFKMINFINHFSYTEKTITFHHDDWLCEGQYALTYGWNQTRVATLYPTVEYFKKIFKEIHYDQYEDKHLLKDSEKNYPWWKDEGSYIIFNKSFVDIFFTEYDGNEDSTDSYIFNKKITLKPIEYKIEDRDSKTRTVTITQEIINEIEEYFNKSNPANESFDNGEFAKKYIDEKTEFIVDCFYNMIKNVYRKYDSEGVQRTKSYFVKDTPFELRTIKDESGNPIKMVGFDLRELIDACFEQLFVADEDAVRNCVASIGGVLGKRNWDISNEKDYEAFFKELQPFFQTALNETASRLNGEFDLEIAKRQAQMMKISQEAGIIYQRKFNTGAKISIGMALAGAVTAKVVKVIVKKAMESVMQAAVREVAKWAAKKAAKKALLFAFSKVLGVVPVIGWAVTIAATLVEIGVFLYCYLRDSYLQAHLAYSDDYVYKFTCRAKKSERLYSMTKRGCIISDVIAEVGQPKLEGETEKTKGDYERVKSYYNWLAEPGEPIPTNNSSLLEFNKKLFGYDLDGNANSISLRDKYDGRVAVIIPSTEEALSDEDVYSDYSESALENIENFIQTWMAKKEVAVESQAELPIEGYYDMLNGMHPYVEVGFRMGLGLCGRKKIDGNADVFYNEAGLPIIVKRGSNYYKVKHNLVSYKDKNGNSVEGYDTGYTYNFSEGSSDLQVISKAEYIKLASRNFRRINSRDYPYFESMTIKDNGVKKVTLKLIDPNFASYTTGIRSYYSAGGKAAKNENGDFVRLDIYDEDDYENKVFSLEQLIRGALRSPTFIKEERIERYSNETGNLKNDFLSIDESLVASPTNLKIRYGYDDFNPSGERFSDSRFVDVAKRDARWWNVRHLGNTNFNTVTHVKKYISDGDIENRGGKWISVKEAKMTEGDGIKPSEDTTTNVENSRGYDVDHYTLLKSNAQTVVMSKEIDFMITNFKSKLTNLGIEYTIEGIETKDANIIRTRFLQRYASINANPEEVLYILMHMFNEDNDGNNIKESRVKILLVSDDEDTQVPLMKDKLNMEFDLKKLKEEEYDATMADNIYEMAYQQEMLMVKEDLLKKINITLGGAAAVKNYGNGNAVNSYTPLYKTLAQLLNEFCSACPPKKKIEKRELVTDENGNDVLSNQASTNSRPLKWFSFEDTAHDTTYVCLYYRTVIKPPKIRVYTYGPMNPTISCVTDLALENANEFAVLSAVRSFDGKKSKLTTRSSNIYAEREEQTNKEEQADKFKLGATWGGTDYVGLNAENYSQAFASCMYNGNMTILGDPFWSFDGLIQPCTYPIKLNVIMPQSEFTRQVDGGKGTADLRKQIEELRAQSNNREVEENYWYGETHERSLKKNIYKNSDPEHENIVCVKPADTVRVHQVLHESSGYYVVKDITQTIDQGGFTTTLGIMSYPNIHKDVLLTPDEAKARSSAKS